MSNLSWCSVVLFEQDVSSRQLIEWSYTLLQTTGFALWGYGLEPLDAQEWDISADDEPIPVSDLDELSDSIISNPGLGNIVARYPIPEKKHSAILIITLRDTRGMPEYADYISLEIGLSEFRDLTASQKAAIYDFHVLKLSVLNPLWITMGVERKLFLTWIAGREEVNKWRQGIGLVPLDHTWVRKDFAEALTFEGEDNVSIQKSDIPALSSYYRLYTDAPISSSHL
jgi:hypothetical protein